MIWSGNETRRNMASFPPSQIYICHFNVSPYEGNLYHRYFCLGQTIYTLPTINKGKGREAKLSLMGRKSRGCSAVHAQDIPTRGSHVEVFLTRSNTFYLQ